MGYGNFANIFYYNYKFISNFTSKSMKKKIRIRTFDMDSMKKISTMEQCGF